MGWSPKNYRDHLIDGGRKTLRHVAKSFDFTNVMTCKACGVSIRVRMIAGIDYSAGIVCPLCTGGKLVDDPEKMATGENVVCPGCDLHVDPFRLIHVASLPKSFRGKQTWACDGCWTVWQRDLRPFEPGQIIASRHEWDMEWMWRLGAPQSVLDLYDGGKP